MKKKRAIRVIKTSLRKAWGEQEGKRIWIDTKHKNSRSLLNTLIHEALHVVFPEAGESRIKRASHSVTRVVWEQNYRRVT